MQIKKEEKAGLLYLMYMYSAGVLRRHTPQQRAARRAKTSEGKRRINKMRRKFRLMLLLAANFLAGRDLFVCLEYDREPDEKTVQNALRNFHRRMTKLLGQYGVTYKYILVTETHNRDGAPVRLHHHIILSGTGRLMLGKIREAWGMGSVDVRVLRELTDNFEDTCRYLLKEDKPDGKRAYIPSRNLVQPPEPLRRKMPEAACGEVPDGVKLVRHVLDSNDFGRYEIMVGKIVDGPAFDRYWERAQRDRRRVEEDANWKKYAKKQPVGRSVSGSKTRLTSRQQNPEKCGRYDVT